MNESGKATEGPWTYLDLGEVVRADDFDVVIATVDYSRENAEADGNLIAAAPELLAVARMAEQVAKMELGEDVSPEFGPNELLEAARSALTKAGSPT